jgi:CRP-like cAMP-binding protein
MKQTVNMLQAGKRAAVPRPGPIPGPALLARLPLLKDVDEALLARLAANARLRALAKREYIIRKGTTGEHLLFLLKGALQVLDITESGREIGLNFLSPGEYFGELSIIDGMPRSASVVATEPSAVLLIPHADALFLFHHSPLVAERLLKRFAERLRRASDFQAILSLPNASQRIYALLSRFVQIAPGGLTVITKMPTQQEIAITVNTSRETVSRAIRALIQQGVVQKDMRRLIVRKPEALHVATLDETGQ